MQKVFILIKRLSEIFSDSLFCIDSIRSLFIQPRHSKFLRIFDSGKLRLYLIVVNLTDTAIIKKIQSGDEPVFESLYAFFYPKLSFFSKQYLLDDEAAANIAQDVFTELWERREDLRENTNIQAWLFTVTKNKSLKAIAREKSKQRYNDYLKARQLEINYQSLSDFDTSNFIFDELRQKIDRALATLSPSVRIVFEKSRFEDKKNKEIAEELGISIKTVEAHVSKALKILRNELKDFLPLLYILFK